MRIADSPPDTNGVPDRRASFAVAVPVLLIDEWMPRLKDTEWRVLLAVLRQTRVLGQESDTTWLTHSEFCRRTGRASEAVSGAISSLVQKGLIAVLNEAGESLVSASARQKAEGHHLYRSLYLENLGSRVTAGKPKTIEDVDIYKHCRFRKAATPVYGAEPRSLSTEERQRIDDEKAKIRKRLSDIST